MSPLGAIRPQLSGWSDQALPDLVDAGACEGVESSSPAGRHKEEIDCGTVDLGDAGAGDVVGVGCSQGDVPETLLRPVPPAREYMVERTRNPARRGGPSSLEWAGDVLAVDDDVGQRVERSASDRMGGGAGVCSQLFDEFG